jgi:ectoine hydroxylase-related dioxygenase (phytanoyl-CoA dioxygenase family)
LLDAAAPVGLIAASALGAECFPVRAILFDKSAAANWSLGWHQDRTIAVRERRQVPGFGPWTVKSGRQHVSPPVAILERMATLRLHLDPVPASNAPLLVARGSHRLGLVAEAEIDNVVARTEAIACLADRGEVWLYRTLILHASAAAAAPRRRRVLQVDYAAQPLPDGLEFLGI